MTDIIMQAYEVLDEIKNDSRLNRSRRPGRRRAAPFAPPEPGGARRPGAASVRRPCGDAGSRTRQSRPATAAPRAAPGRR